MLWDHGSTPEPVVEVPPLTEREIIAHFGKWWDAPDGFGKTRDPGHERYDHTPCLRRFIEGWRDSENHRSDFKRRGMPWDNGERSAYMTARFLSSAERMTRRRLIARTPGESV